MSRDDFYKPTDADALRMENELLAFEVRFLKTRLTEAEREAEQLRSRLAKAERQAERLRSRLAKAKRVEKDLVLLLRRLANSPLGWFIRFKKGFRVMEQRYLGTDPGDAPTKLGCEKDDEW